MQSGTNGLFDEHQIRIMLEGRGGWRGRLLRTLLWLPGRAYGCAMTMRRSWYESGRIASHRLAAPVISIGNLTAGGSGKTPFAIALESELSRRGYKPCIVLRGYKRMADGESDEALLYRRLSPQSIVETDPDRTAAGKRAIQRGATVILVDDGFQHLRLKRDIDIVLIDATSPWGGGMTIPGGLLREPAAALSRAGIIIITRSDQVEPEQIAAIVHTVRTLAPQALVATAKHGLASFYPLRQGAPGSQADDSYAAAGDQERDAVFQLDGCKVVALSGIARPEAFVQTLRSAGAEVVEQIAGPDHRDFSTELVEKALAAAKLNQALVVITEKDAMKTIFRETSANRVDSKYIRVLGIRQEVAGWDQVVETVCSAIEARAASE
ncbi:MAG: tetraacyldisaccharide 4'-kinase [Planctomycetes bacterium]|nr:tetraacyldisaccharide 4'-kinase [Planctomycetota bacterium]